ncbi:MAG: YbaN family protein, partial [Isosphaeraceae bacterium]
MAAQRRRNGELPEPVAAEESATTAYDLDIEIREQEGLLWVYDPRAFHPGRREFCRRLIDSALGQPGVRRAEVRLDTSCCRIDFDRKSATPAGMADTFAAAVRAAIPGSNSRWRPRAWLASGQWTALTAYRTEDGLSTWETLEASPGRLRLRHPSLTGDRARLAQLADAMAELDGVSACRVSWWSHTLTLDLAPGEADPAHLVDIAQAVQADRRASAAAGRSVRGEEVDNAVELVTGPRRIVYLALGGGSFILTMIGLVIPGVPTVPFLLATSYYLARSSPWLDERLRRAPLFGPILAEWEAHHGLSRGSKMELMGLTGTIVVVTLILAPASPLALLVLALVSTASIAGIAHLPGPDAEPTNGRPSTQSVPRAL